jgi:hypothetical protein
MERRTGCRIPRGAWIEGKQHAVLRDLQLLLARAYGGKIQGSCVSGTPLNDNAMCLRIETRTSET